MSGEGNLKSKYIIGIDFGTTNIAVSFVDTHQANLQIQNFALEQYISSTEISKKDTLPSFLFFPLNEKESETTPQKEPSKLKKSSKIKLFTGLYAREQSQLTPNRVISSSKSWLCHTGVDRNSDILPWQGSEDITPLSPTQACSELIQHIIHCWDAEFTNYQLSSQQIILTVPASFDEVARSLTVQAAHDAGLTNITLLEEPQAAFYSWMYKNQDEMKATLKDQESILVCDIGGGTSDFSLIGIQKKDEDRIQFERKSVGDHLLLGGDNLDLTIAYLVEQKINGSKKLGARDWGRLVSISRQAKEDLLQENSSEEYLISLGGTGRKIIGGLRQTSLQKKEVLDQLLEGFMPQVDLDTKLSSKRSGFQEFGLPYASDSAITRHLANFLNQQSNLGKGGPSYILFNGGFFESKLFQKRILDQITAWYGKEPKLLHNERLDLAVATGASYYGLVQRGIGNKIVGGLPRSTFIAVQDENHDLKAVCLAPAGMEEGQKIELKEQSYHLRINQPVEFPMFSAQGLNVIQPGTMIDTDDLSPLPPIRSLIKSGKKKKKAKDVDVFLSAELTPLGILELWCKENQGERKWRLDFDTKALIDQKDSTSIDSNQEDEASPLNQDFLRDDQKVQIEEEINSTFSGEVSQRSDPDSLVKRLEKIIEKTRWEWDLIILRFLWNKMYDAREGRKINPTLEIRWLNFTGFCLRPGYGVNMDDWRVKQTWNLFREGVQNPKNQQCQADWWLLWSRIAGGLENGQQKELVAPYIAALKNLESQELSKEEDSSKTVAKQHKNTRVINAQKSKKLKMGQAEGSEFWRLAGSLERLDIKTKASLLTRLVKEIKLNGPSDKQGKCLWALGRIGARIPLYGPLNLVLAPKYITRILPDLMKIKQWEKSQLLSLAFLVRKTNDRYRDIDEEMRKDLLAWLKQYDINEHIIEIIDNGGEVSEDDKGVIFGEKLPSGLRVK